MRRPNRIHLRHTTEQFIQKARNKHGDKYDYSKTNYTKSRDRVIITCLTHGDFEQVANNHLNGNGCDKCAREYTTNKKRKDTDSFIQEARGIHGDKYDYSKTEYIQNNKKIIITCLTHGDFEQVPYAHLLGQGCNSCAIMTQSEKILLPQEEFIRKVSIVHQDKNYDYSKIVYTGYTNSIIVTCPTHGDFKTNAGNHISGRGCKQCAIEENARKIVELKRDNFEERVRKIHGDKYDYSKTNYTKATEKIIITYLTHGDFEQVASNHLRGNGCPDCFYESTSSKAELEIQDFVQTLGIPFIANDRTTIYNPITDRHLELDLLIHEHNKAIEYNGIYWHSLPDTVEKDIFKQEECARLNIDLLTIYEEDWIQDKDQCLHSIAQFLTH